MMLPFTFAIIHSAFPVVAIGLQFLLRLRHWFWFYELWFCRRGGSVGVNFYPVSVYMWLRCGHVLPKSTAARRHSPPPWIYTHSHRCISLILAVLNYIFIVNTLLLS